LDVKNPKTSRPRENRKRKMIARIRK